MEYLRWKRGRQETGYEKMLLVKAKWPKPFDMYLLRFSPGDEIPPHRDEVGEGQHFRVNIILKNAKEGGQFICKELIYESKHIKYFRPDQSEHQVTKIIEGNRYVFSFGWIQKV
jgi:hypothetical protein